MKTKKRHVLYFLSFILVIATSIANYQYKCLAINLDFTENDTIGTFRIMTYNVNREKAELFTEDDQRRLLDEIKLYKPNIVCFQELSFESLKKIKPQLDSIYGTCDTLRGDDQMWRLRFYSKYNLRNYKRYQSIGDIDTLGLDSVELCEYKHLKLQMPVMSAELEVQPGKWVTIMSGHLRSSAYSTARRSMDKSLSWFAGIPLYKRNYEIGKRIRDYEAENVRRFVDEERALGNTVIVAGDLNDWCGSDCINMLMNSNNPDDELKDAWWEGGNGFGFTYDGWHLRLRLDHILYSKELELVNVDVIDSDFSDHRPLIADFKIKK